MILKERLPLLFKIHFILSTLLVILLFFMLFYFKKELETARKEIAGYRTFLQNYKRDQID